MQAITVKYNQTNVDAALLVFGTLERLFELPNIAAGASITDELVAGDLISNIANADFDKRSVLRILNQEQNLPASKKIDTGDLLLEGIDYWAIGTEFIIS